MSASENYIPEARLSDHNIGHNLARVGGVVHGDLPLRQNKIPTKLRFMYAAEPGLESKAVPRAQQCAQAARPPLLCGASGLVPKAGYGDVGRGNVGHIAFISTRGAEGI